MAIYQIYRIILWTTFSIYLCISSYLLIFERAIVRIKNFFNGNSINRYYYSESENVSRIDSFIDNSNLVPFSNTYHYLTGTDHFPLIVIFNNIIGNILVFLPLGLLLPLLFRSYRKFSKILLKVTLSTVLVEVTQTTFRIGQFDVDDIILNLFGGLLGYLLAIMWLYASKNLLKSLYKT